MRYLAVLGVLALTACQTPPGTSPGQALVDTTGSSCRSLGAAIAATDQAVLSGVLKKKQAEEATKALTAAQLACTSALTSIQGANP